MDPISKRHVDLVDKTVTLPATRNHYLFRYVNGPMHGTSRFVEGEKGSFIRMAVAVEGGV